MDDRDSRIAAKARELWSAAGKPEHRSEADFRTEASEILAIRDSQASTLLPNPADDDENRPYGEPAEPILAVQNQENFPP